MMRNTAALSEVPGRLGRPLTPASLHRIRATLRVALNAAVRDGLLRHNPARNVELRTPRRPPAQVWTASRVEAWRDRGERSTVAVWTEHQFADFIRFVAADRLYGMWWLVSLRGLRRGEAAGLRWVDVDLEGRSVTINQQRLAYGRTVAVGPPKTVASRRTIALDRTTVAVLRAHRRRQETERAAAGPAWRDSGYVFTTTDGQPLHPDFLTRRFRALVGRSGLPPVRLHDLRHGAASLAHSAGADLKTIQEQLGHSGRARTGAAPTGHPRDTHSPQETDLGGERPGQRVRRQGLEPRTRGLRVRCSAN
jgi:integrase